MDRNGSRYDQSISIIPGPELFIRLKVPGTNQFYQWPVRDFLEARTIVQKYISNHKPDIQSWEGGEILDRKGNNLARISYNGRLWKPDHINAAQKNRLTKKPYAPILIHHPNKKQLIIWYSFLYKEIELGEIPRKSWHFYVSDPHSLDAGLEIRINSAGLWIQQVYVLAKEGWKPKPDGEVHMMALPQTLELYFKKAHDYETNE